MAKRKLITHYEQIVENAKNFNDVLYSGGRDSIACKRFSQFSHWYYFPELDIFAPSKFIGYEGTTIDNYVGAGHGRKTTETLDEFFVKAPASELRDLERALRSNYCVPLGKELNALTVKKGLIYLPKKRATRGLDARDFDDEVRQACELSERELMKKLRKTQSDEVGKATRQVEVFERNPYVVAAALKKSKGRCGCCGNEGFEREDGSVYLEVHHVKRLADGGADKLENAAAVCPNCHRELHHGTKKAKRRLISQLRANLSHLSIEE